VDFQNIAGDVSLDFANTLEPVADDGQRSESLASYGHLADWALQAGLVTRPQHEELLREARARPSSAKAALRRALHFRECLTGLVIALVEHRRPAPGDLLGFNACLGQALSRVRLEPAPGGYRLDRAGEQQFDSILWAVATQASELLASSQVHCIRRCQAETCRWLFLDQSRNHSRRWCDMNVCGNRAKARRFYRQRKPPR
jgi:predicted RNA-binding Zn ribbon-like protein